MNDDIFTRFVTNLADRIHGPFTFRFVFQPLMAVFLAVRDGVLDARAGRAPFLWAIVGHSGQRGSLIRAASVSLGRVLVLGVVMDVAYQLLMFRWVYPLELVVTVLFVVVVPYVLVRGPVNRFVRLRYLGASPTSRTEPRPRGPASGR